MNEKMTINPKLEQHLKDLLSSHGVPLEDLQKVFQDSYQMFQKEEELSSKFFPNFDENQYMSIIQGIADGYSLEEMSQELGISQFRIDSFQKDLSRNNLSVELVKAFHKYTIGSNMILGAKRGIPREDILKNILLEFDSRMTEYGFSKDQISQIQNYMENLDYSLPLYQNYKWMKEFLQQYGMPSKYVATVQSSVRNLDSYYHLTETLSILDKGLTKGLPESIKLFRAVKRSFLEKFLRTDENLTDLVGHRIEEVGYSSTSPFYDTSFAKYEDYDVVFEIYAPKGTQGVFITPFSSYGEAEQEVLLNSNDFYITEVVPEVVDQNSRKKIICKSLALSKDMSCYQGISSKEISNSNFDYRQKLNRKLENVSNDKFLYLEFTRYENQKGQDRCHSIIYSVREGEEKEILLEDDFEYTEQFIKNILEPCLQDFARKSPIHDVRLKPTPRQNFEQISKGTRSDINFWNESNGMMTIHNIDTFLAVEMQKQVYQVVQESSHHK